MKNENIEDDGIMKLITKTSMLIYLIALLITSYWIGSSYFDEDFPVPTSSISSIIAKITLGIFPAYLVCSLIYCIYLLLKMINSDYGN